MFSKKYGITVIQDKNFKVLLFDDRQIGKGSFGKCYQGYLPNQDKIVIVKRLDCTEKQKMKGFINNYEKQLKNLYAASQHYRKELHSNIVNVQKYRIVKEKPYKISAFIVMEYCLQGSLQQLQRRRRVDKESFSFGQISTIMRDLINGYGQLYAQQIIHQDLKPDNIFINEGHFKIGDFGLSHKLTDKKINNGGTPSYNAPEKYTSKFVHSSSQDIYSLGIIFYKLLYDSHPYYEPEEFDDYLKKQVNEYFNHRKEDEQIPFESILRQSVKVNLKQKQFKNEREKNVFKAQTFYKFIKSRKIDPHKMPKIKLNVYKEEQKLWKMINLVHRMISFNPQERPTFHKLLQQFETLGTQFQPVKIKYQTSIPQRYRSAIEGQSPFQFQILPYELLEDQDIRQNEQIYLIKLRAEKINVMANLLVDVSVVIESQIRKYKIYNECINKMVTALNIFGYCLTYHQYIGIVHQIDELSKQNLSTFYRTRQDYLVNNTKNNKEYFENQLENYLELRSFPTEKTFLVMEKFIQQTLKEGIFTSDVLIDANNTNCFMIITVIMDLVEMENREFFTIEQILQIREKYKEILKKFDTFKSEEVSSQLKKYNIIPGLVECGPDD